MISLQMVTKARVRTKSEFPASYFFSTLIPVHEEIYDSLHMSGRSHWLPMAGQLHWNRLQTLP